MKVTPVLLSSGLLLLTGCTSTEETSETYTSTSTYGKVVSVTSDTITITENGTEDAEETSVPISSSTPIIKDDTTISCDELNTDDYVLITMTDGTPTVVDVLDQDEVAALEENQQDQTAVGTPDSETDTQSSGSAPADQEQEQTQQKDTASAGTDSQPASSPQS